MAELTQSFKIDIKGTDDLIKLKKQLEELKATQKEAKTIDEKTTKAYVDRQQQIKTLNAEYSKQQKEI